jgi:uncharacterized protein YuzE
MSDIYVWVQEAGTPSARQVENGRLLTDYDEQGGVVGVEILGVSDMEIDGVGLTFTGAIPLLGHTILNGNPPPRKARR